MDRLSEDVPASCPVDGAVKVVQSLSLLIKIDFWIRNPDYLADELLTEMEQQRQPADLLPHVATMIGGRSQRCTLPKGKVPLWRSRTA